MATHGPLFGVLEGLTGTFSAPQQGGQNWPLFVSQGKAAGGDSAPPTVENMVPAPGEISSDSVIDFDVLDVAPGVVLVAINLKYTSSPETIVVHDGVEFKTPFNTAASERIAITDGFHFRVAPAGGWTGNFIIDIKAVDGDGNLLG